MENRFTLDPNFLMPVPEGLPMIEELEEYQKDAIFREIIEDEMQQISYLQSHGVIL